MEKPAQERKHRKGRQPQLLKSRLERGKRQTRHKICSSATIIPLRGMTAY
jgi:hypothetical protein